MKNDPYIVATYLNAKERDNWTADGTSPLVTISRQRGAQGSAIGARTAEILTDMSRDAHPWIMVDKDLAEHVIEDHHLPKRISSFFTDEQTLSIEDHLEGMLGISVTSATMIEKMTRTIVRLAKLGHIVFVGRAAHVITAKFPRAVHVRIIGSFDRRVQRVVESRQCSWDKAAEEVRMVDKQRHHFGSSYFNTNLDDPEKYDMVLNTDRISVEEGAHVIAQLISSPNFREQEAKRLRELREQVLGRESQLLPSIF
jgi:cytidylate kinase